MTRPTLPGILTALFSGRAPTGDLPPLARVSRIVIVVVGVKAVLHVLTAFFTPYEFHRDELLYFGMGTHLRLFSMDFPPFIAMLSELLRSTVGVSVASYRLAPAFFAVALMLLTIAIARRLGGGRTAQVLAALALLTGPLFLRTGGFFHPVVFDQVWWGLGCYALVRLQADDNVRWWLLLGVAGGLGLLSKFSILFFGAAVLAGLLMTPRRRDLLGGRPWLALGVALLIGAPSVVGQIALDFPVVRQMGELREEQLVYVTLPTFALGQVLMIGPAIALAAIGLVALLRSVLLARWRLLGWVAVMVFVQFLILRGKPYYVGPIYPLLFAAGGVWLERWDRRALRATLVWGVGGMSLAFGLAVVPFGLPIVPPEPMARYAAATGVGAATTTNTNTRLPLPQDYADMLGWREQAEAVARVFRTLPPGEQRTAGLYASNYGRAGALDLYGRRLGLPPVVSLAGSWYYFGPGDRAGPAFILLGVEPREVITLACDTVFVAERVNNPWGVEEEHDVPVTLCRGAKRDLKEVWVRFARGEDE
ncbi:MAG: glycosyltransferase family 39 protein [Gemmatimonadetes bacterium]|nr:glycosyltransferase family 39 protein [Gemmatimonadota bacterium]